MFQNGKHLGQHLVSGIHSTLLLSYRELSFLLFRQFICQSCGPFALGGYSFHTHKPHSIHYHGILRIEGKHQINESEQTLCNPSGDVSFAGIDKRHMY